MYLLYIYNNTSDLKLKILKRYLEASALFLLDHIFYLNPTSDSNYKLCAEFKAFKKFCDLFQKWADRLYITKTNYDLNHHRS